jgi:hypothetical protein
MDDVRDTRTITSNAGISWDTSASAAGNSGCSVAITGATKIGITKQFQLTATGSPGQRRGSYSERDGQRESRDFTSWDRP